MAQPRGMKLYLFRFPAGAEEDTNDDVLVVWAKSKGRAIEEADWELAQWGYSARARAKLLTDEPRRVLMDRPGALFFTGSASPPDSESMT